MNSSAGNPVSSKNKKENNLLSNQEPALTRGVFKNAWTNQYLVANLNSLAD